MSAWTREATSMTVPIDRADAPSKPELAWTDRDELEAEPESEPGLTGVASVPAEAQG